MWSLSPTAPNPESLRVDSDSLPLAVAHRGHRDTVSTVHRRGRDEESVRILLDDHIHTVTILVQRLSRDIEALQDQLRNHDDVDARTWSAVRSMELRQLSALSDLRGRVGRCDNNIARLGAEIRSTNENLHRLSKENHASKTVMESKLKEMEIQVCLICSQAEQNKSKNTPDSQTDTKLKELSDELKTQITAIQNWLRKEQDSTLKEVVDKFERLCHLIKDKTDSNEKVTLAKYTQLLEKLDNLEEAQRANTLPNQTQNLEDMIDSRVTKIQKQLWEEMQEMREETNRGFTVIHESLGTLRQVLEARMKLEREQLQRQIRLACRRGSGLRRKESPW
ncbi:protein FAM81A-like [Chanos chanos]|uniref:Protein FAM81A-like n=1 Tax=Chanos chanos TaxID=29144 RepID=A0A6J2UPI2_CHACN|nr:protein FAM81A [Chanos chanos]